MPRIILIFFMSAVVSFIVYGQGLKNPQLEDSSLSKTQQHNSEAMHSFPMLSLRTSFDAVPEYYPLSLHQALFLPSSTPPWKMDRTLDIAEIWRAGMVKEEEFKTLRLVLGYVKVGGVAYLAYKHLKKYGLK
ncbi:MAG: hypothetical protein WCS69_15545 [Ignavibacteriaceae bacterium]|jgi:hypothetical protein